MSAWLDLAAHDLRVEARSRDTLVPLLLTGLLVATVGLLAYHDVAERASVASGVTWSALAFAAALGLSRAFGAEQDRGTLDTLLTLPVARSSLYLAKAASGFVLMLTLAFVVVPLYLLASGDTVAGSWLALGLILVLGALGLSVTGTMLSMLTAQARAREALLPVLLFPLLIPLLIATLHGTLAILQGEPFDAWRPELFVLAGYDIAFLAASALLFEQAVGA